MNYWVWDSWIWVRVIVDEFELVYILDFQNIFIFSDCVIYFIFILGIVVSVCVLLRGPSKGIVLCNVTEYAVLAWKIN